MQRNCTVRKWISLIVAFLLVWPENVRAVENIVLDGNNECQPVREAFQADPLAANAGAPITTPIIQDTAEFLRNTLGLLPDESCPEMSGEIKAESGENEIGGKDSLPEEADRCRELERYDLETALDHLRPEYAAAVIVSGLDEAGLKELIGLDFEVGIVALHGEIVLFTSGSQDEIGILPAVKELLEKASFISHTHPNLYADEGPSGQDLESARALQKEEWVLTRAGIYAYDGFGLANESPYSYGQYLGALQAAREQTLEDNSAEAREDLNRFITWQDRYNSAAELERKVLHRGGTFSYTASLTSSSVTKFSGTPNPYYMAGASVPTSLALASDGRFKLGYDVKQTGAFSGMTISFDDASTATVETQNISAMSYVTFGLLGTVSAVKVEFIDANGKKDVFTLTNISSTIERFWRIPVASLVSGVDKTRIRQINAYVNQSTTSALARTGTLLIRANGLSTAAPKAPAVTSQVPKATKQKTFLVQGSKAANTSVLLNGVEIVKRDASICWSAVVDLAKEGVNALNFTTRNSIGKTSAAAVIKIVRDTTPPKIVFTSAGNTTDERYVLRYTKDGSVKTRDYILGRGENKLTFYEEDSLGNGADYSFAVTLVSAISSCAAAIRTPEDDAALMMTTEEGATLKYQSGKLVSIETTEGVRLSAPELDEEKNLSGGSIQLPGGGGYFFRDGTLVYFVDPSGMKYYYKTDGMLDSMETERGDRSVVSYEKDAQGNIAGILLTTGGNVAVYDPDGRLVKHFPRNGENAVFDRGILTSCKAADGSLTLFNVRTEGDGFISVRDGTAAGLPQKLSYDANRELSEAVLDDGTVIRFDNGLASTVKKPDGLETSFSYDSDAYSFLTRIEAARAGYRIQYRAQGDFESLLTELGEAVSGTGAVTEEISLEDGSILKDYTLIQDGEIRDGTLIEPNGRRLKYVNGEVTRVDYADGSFQEFLSGELIRWRTQDGLTYRYRTVTTDEGDRREAVLEHYESGEGNSADFESGVLKEVLILADEPGPATEECSLRRIKTKNAKLSNVSLDDSGKIFNADVEFTDGRIYRVRNYVVEDYVTPDGIAYRLGEDTGGGGDPGLPEFSPLDEEETALRQNCIARGALYFKEGSGVDERTGLPLDYLDAESEEAPAKGLFSQPTSIGFYLQVLGAGIGGGDLAGIFERDEMIASALKTMRSLEQIQREIGCKGLLPFIDLAVPPQAADPVTGEPVFAPLARAMSDVIGFGDNAGLAQSLATFIGTLREGNFTPQELCGIEELIQTAETVLGRMGEGFSSFYDPSTGWFRAAYHRDSGRYEHWMDRLFQEFRPSLAFVISRFDLPEEAWDRLVLVSRDYELQSGESVKNWVPYDGSAFQMFWPLIRTDELKYDSMRRVLYNFLLTSADFSNERGLSGFPSASFVPGSDYTGKAGIGEAAETFDPLCEDVASIHALAAAYSLEPHFVLRWMKEILEKKSGIFGPYGFFDSMNGAGDIGKRYYAAHQAVMLLSLMGTGPQDFENYLDGAGLREKYDSLYGRLKLDCEPGRTELPRSPYESADPASGDLPSFSANGEGLIEFYEDPLLGRVEFLYYRDLLGRIQKIEVCYQEGASTIREDLVSFLQNSRSSHAAELVLERPLENILERGREMNPFYTPGVNRAELASVYDPESGYVHELSYERTGATLPLGVYAKTDPYELADSDFISLRLRRETGSDEPQTVKIELKGAGQFFIVPLTDQWETVTLPVSPYGNAIDEIVVALDGPVSSAETGKIYFGEFTDVRMRRFDGREWEKELGETPESLAALIAAYQISLDTVPAVQAPVQMKYSGIVLDPEGKLTGASETDSLGNRRIYENGKIRYWRMPDDGEVFFDGEGRAVNALLADGRELQFEYRRGADGQLEEIAVKSSGEEWIYGPGGDLLRTVCGGFSAKYDKSGISEIVTEGETITRLDWTEEGEIRNAEITKKDGSVLTVRDGEVENERLADGTLVFYRDGRVIAIESVLNGRTDFFYSSDGSGDLDRVYARYIAAGNAVEKNIVDYLSEEGRSCEAEILLEGALAGVFDQAYNVGSFWNRKDPDDWDSKGVELKPFFDGERGDIYALSFNPELYQDWLGLYVKFFGLELSNFDYVSVGLRTASPENALPDATLELKGEGGARFEIRGIPKTWTDYLIPLGEREGLLDEVTLLAGEGKNLSSWCTILIDHIAFLKLKRRESGDWKSEVGFSSAELKALKALLERGELLQAPVWTGKELPQKEFSKIAALPLWIGYDASGNARSFERVDGTRGKIGPDSNVESLDFNGGSVFQLEGAGGSPFLGTLTGAEGSDASPLEVSYELGKMREVVNSDGGRFSYSYEFDGEGKEITVVTDEAAGAVMRYRDGLLTSVADPEGLETRYRYDEKGVLAGSEVYVRGRFQESNQYRNQDDKVLLTDEIGTTRYYDKDGNLIAHRTPDGFYYEHVWGPDEGGTPFHYVNLKEHLCSDGTRLIYEGGAVTGILFPGGKKLSGITCNGSGEMTGARLDQPNGSWALFEGNLPRSFFDPSAGVTEAFVLPESGIVRIETDEKGNPSFITRELPEVFLRYDLSGRLVNLKNRKGELYAYSYRENQAGVTDRIKVIRTSPLVINQEEIPAKWSVSLKQSDPLGMQFFRNDQFLFNDAGGGVVVILIDPETGEMKEKRIFLQDSNSFTSSLASYLNNIPDGDWACLATSGGKPFPPSEEREALLAAIQKFGMTEAEVERLAGLENVPWTAIGRKGAPRETAVFREKKEEALYFLTTHSQSCAYFDGSGKPLSSAEFYQTDKILRGAFEYVEPGSVTEVIGTFGNSPYASAYFKNFNLKYPDSGFYRIWPDFEWTELSSANDVYKNDLMKGILDIGESFGERAVYYDDRYALSSEKRSWSWLADDKGGLVFKAYLAERGYRVLDAEELADWLQTKGPDAFLVMAQDVIPDTLFADGKAADSLIRPYFDRGGGMLWMHDTPFYFIDHPEGPNTVWGDPGDLYGLKRITGVASTQKGTYSDICFPEARPMFDESALFLHPLKYPIPLSWIVEWNRIKNILHAADCLPDQVTQVVYDGEERLRYLKKGSGEETLFEDGKVDLVLDKEGYVVLDYEYDADGRPVKITFAKARRELEDNVLRARDEILLKKLEALREVACAHHDKAVEIRNAYADYRGEINSEIASFEAQRFQRVCQSFFCFETCETVEVSGVSDAIERLRGQLGDSYHEEINAYVQLDQEIARASGEVDQAVSRGYEELDKEALRQREEVTRNEMRIVIVHFYRQILGREPSAGELGQWGDRFLSQGTVDTELLMSQLETGEERALKIAGIEEIKSRVRESLGQYLSADPAGRAGFLAGLGLREADAVPLTGDDGEQILEGLETYSIHFGFSAFKVIARLLENASKDVSFADLAAKAILIDIVTGVLNRFDEEELLISLFALEKVAGIYGLELTPARLSWEELKVRMAENTREMILHVNGAHYIVLREIRGDEVVYWDPNLGSGGDCVTASAGEFLKAWLTEGMSRGVVLAPDGTIPETNRMMQTETQRVRGAFFWFFVISVVIGGLINAISQPGNFFVNFLKGAAFSAIVTVATAGIGSILSGFSATFQSVGQAILGGLRKIAEFFQPILNFINGQLSFAGNFLRNPFFIGLKDWVTGAFGSYWRALGTVGSYIKTGIGRVREFLFPAASPAQKLAVEQVLARRVIGAALDCAITKGLEKLNINPSLARLAGAFITGAILGAKAGAMTTSVQSFVRSALQNLALKGVNEIALHLDLPPPVAALIRFVTESLVGKEPPAGILSEKLRKVAATIAGEYAFQGLEKLAKLIGVEPELASLAANPLLSSIRDLFTGGAEVIGKKPDGTPVKTSRFYDLGKTLFGLLKGAASAVISKIGFQFTGLADRLFGSLKSIDIQNMIESTLKRPGIFEGIFKFIQKILLIPVNVVQGVVDSVLGRAKKFDDLIREKGLAGSLEGSMTAVFSRKTVEDIAAQGGAESVLAKPRRWVFLPDGGEAEELRISETASLYFDAAGVLVGIRDDGAVKIGRFAIDANGKFGLLAGEMYGEIRPGMAFKGKVRAGQMESFSVCDADGTVLESEEGKGGSVIVISDPGGDGIGPAILCATLKLALYGTKLFLGDGVLKKIETVVSQGLTAPVVTSAKELYVLTNGIANPHADSGQPPDYIRNLSTDMAKLGNGEVSPADDILATPIYLNSSATSIDIVIDVAKWIAESQIPVVHFELVGQMISNINGFLADKKAWLRPLVGVGFSGGFAPLVEAVYSSGYNAKTLLALGAPHVNITNLVKLGGNALNLVLDIAQKIESGILDGVEGALCGLGFGGKVIGAVLGFLGRNLIGKALEILKNGVQELFGLASYGLPVLAGKTVEMIVNVWGSKDAVAGVFGGYRDEIAGLKTSAGQVFNIEIEGAKHSMYMRRDEGKLPPDTDPVLAQKIHTFVTELVLHSSNRNKLQEFLIGPFLGALAGTRIVQADGRYLVKFG